MPDTQDWFDVHAPTADPKDAHIGAPPADRPVTIADFEDNPGAAMARVGAILKRDVSDPKTWLMVAAQYFGPKAITALLPGAARAGAGGTVAAPSEPGQPGFLSRMSSAVEPGDVGIVSPRLGKIMDLAQRMRAAVTPAPTSPVESAPAPAPSAPPVATPLAPAPRPTPAQWMPAGGLTDTEAQAVDGLVRQGYDRDQVLAELAKQKAAPAMPPKPTLKAAESKEFLRLLTAGKTPAEAMRLIEQQRALAASLGTPNSESVRQSVADRNATGRWPQ